VPEPRRSRHCGRGRQAPVQPVWRHAGEPGKAPERQGRSWSAFHRLADLAGRPGSDRRLPDRRPATVLPQREPGTLLSWLQRRSRLSIIEGMTRTPPVSGPRALTTLEAALAALLDGVSPVAPSFVPLDQAMGRIAAAMPAV